MDTSPTEICSEPTLVPPSPPPSPTSPAFLEEQYPPPLPVSKPREVATGESATQTSPTAKDTESNECHVGADLGPPKMASDVSAPPPDAAMDPPVLQNAALQADLDTELDAPEIPPVTKKPKTKTGMTFQEHRAMSRFVPDPNNPAELRLRREMDKKNEREKERKKRRHVEAMALAKAATAAAKAKTAK